MHGYADFPTRILTYLAVTGLNVLITGVKWSQLPMKFYKRVVNLSDFIRCPIAVFILKLCGF